MKKVKKGFDASQLALNIDKTHSVIFHSPQRKIDKQIAIKFMTKILERQLSNFQGSFLMYIWNRNHTCKFTTRDFKSLIFFPVLFIFILRYSSFGVLSISPVIVSQKKIVRIWVLKSKLLTLSRFLSEPQFLKVRSWTSTCFSYLWLSKQDTTCSFSLIFCNFHNFNTRQACKGDLFLSRKTTFQYMSKSRNSISWCKAMELSPSVNKSDLSSHSVSVSKHKRYCLPD